MLYQKLFFLTRKVNTKAKLYICYAGFGFISNASCFIDRMVLTVTNGCVQ